MAKHLHVYVLYCGQGMTNWIEFYATDADRDAPRPRPAMTAIVDLGGNVEAASDAIAERLALFDPACRRIELVVISHKDSDHWSLIPAFVTKIAGTGVTVHQIWKGGRLWKENGKAAVAALAAATGCTLNRSFEDFRDDFGHPIQLFPRDLCSRDGCRIRVICVNVECKRSIANGTSAVIEVELGNLCIILPGDATYETMVWLVTLYKNNPDEFKRCYGMSIPHHGALATASDNYVTDHAMEKTTLTTLGQFITQTGPQQAVASAGQNNIHRHPLLQVMNEFEAVIDKHIPVDKHFMQMWDYSHKKGSAAIDPPPERCISSWTTSSYEEIIPPPGTPPPDSDGDVDMSGEIKKRDFINPAYKHKAQDVLFKIDSAGNTQVMTRPVYPRTQHSTAAATAPAPTDAEIKAHIARRAGAAD